jgi:Flp pilus assembly protein TadB
MDAVGGMSGTVVSIKFDVVRCLMTCLETLTYETSPKPITVVWNQTVNRPVLMLLRSLNAAGVICWRVHS